MFGRSSKSVHILHVRRDGPMAMVISTFTSEILHRQLRNKKQSASHSLMPYISSLRIAYACSVLACRASSDYCLFFSFLPNSNSPKSLNWMCFRHPCRQCTGQHWCSHCSLSVLRHKHGMLLIIIDYVFKGRSMAIMTWTQVQQKLHGKPVRRTSRRQLPNPVNFVLAPASFPLRPGHTSISSRGHHKPCEHNS